MGLEPTTLRLRVSCSTDWASRADIYVWSGMGKWARNCRMGQKIVEYSSASGLSSKNHIFYCKVTNFHPVLIFVLSKKVLNLILYENFFLLWGPWISTFFGVFVLRPSKVRKLVCTNQFQVKSTKMGTGRNFETLQYVLKIVTLYQDEEKKWGVCLSLRQLPCWFEW